MKSNILYIILVIATFIQLSCKVRQKGSFIQSIEQTEITLKDFSSPHIIFILQSGDSIRFSKQDFVDIIDQTIAAEVKNRGYSSSPHFSALAESLSTLTNDTTVFQNLSAVDINTISGNLDSWIAIRLLLKGKAGISLKEHGQKPHKLKYIYTRDILGGEQGSFYYENREIYSAVIAWGE